jgi:exodeoxyribonuclease V alpha subunit
MSSLVEAIRKAAGKTGKSDLTPAPDPDTTVKSAIIEPGVVLEKVEIPKEPLETFSLSVVLNSQQLLGAQYAQSGKSFVFTGKAGTGKTTGAREIARMLLKHGVLGKHNFYQGGGDYVTSHSIAICAYTNRATDNIREALHKDPELRDELAANVVTIHKLLEFAPTMVWSEEKKEDVFRFLPRRTKQNPLDITHLIMEEASMTDAYQLWKWLFDALRPGTVVIFLGDINQLPPIFGPSVLNYALRDLPVVELTEVYRQAQDSPVLMNAHRVLEGKSLISDGKYFKHIQSKPGGKLVLQQTQGSLLINSLKKWYKTGEYNPKTDIILSPINKAQSTKTEKANACSTTVLNYQIAHFLGEFNPDGRPKVHHVIAGLNTWYLAVGDRVMINKKDGYIKSCNPNGLYVGRMPKSITHEINRFGQYVASESQIKNTGTEGMEDDFELIGFENLNVDSQLAEEEKKQQASHVVTIELDDGGTETLDSAGDFADSIFSLGYCLSVHKAQGSEFRKVIFVVHRDFSNMLYRELIYTAITRAKEYCTVIDLSNCIDQGISNQRIKGKTLKEKIEWFNSKISLEKPVEIVP